MAEIVEQKVGIPESITINGITYLVKETPELQQFIQSVAKVEKSKLYTQFENLKTQINNLGKVKVEETPADIDAIVEKLRGTFVTKEDFKESLPGVIKEVVQPVLTATEQTRKDELQQYRDKIIQENAASCIPDLVKGETKEELDAALKESIRIRASYPSPNTEHNNDGGKAVDPVIIKQAQESGVSLTPTQEATQAKPDQTPTPPPAPKVPAIEAGEQAGVKSMTMKEFGERRDSLLQNLENMYGGGSL